MVEQIAADFARKIAIGQRARWGDLPGNAEPADDYGVSARTIGRAGDLIDCPAPSGTAQLGYPVVP